MTRFEESLPWFLVITAVFAIGIGLESSPAHIPLSAAIFDGGMELKPPAVYYLAEDESIEELIKEDLKRDTILTQTRIYIPYEQASLLSQTSYNLPQFAR